MRTLARFAVAVGTAALAISAACSLVVDTTGLSGGAADATPIDAAGADGAADGGGDATTWCGQQSSLAFCDDFDSPNTNLAARWDEVYAPSGTLRVDDQNPLSPPGMLLAIVPNPGNNDGNSVAKVFPAHASTRVALDLILEASDSFGYGSIAEVHLEPAPAPYQDYRAALIYTGGRMTLNTYVAPGGENSMPVPRSFGSWQRVQLEIALTPTPRAVVYDEAGGILVTLPMPATAPAAGTRVAVGLPYLATATTPWRVRIDNVAVSTGD